MPESNLKSFRLHHQLNKGMFQLSIKRTKCEFAQGMNCYWVFWDIKARTFRIRGNKKQILETHSHKWKKESRKKTIQFSRAVTFPLLRHFHGNHSSFIEKNKRTWKWKSKALTDIQMNDVNAPFPPLPSNSRCVMRSLSKQSKLQLWLLKKLHIDKSAYLSKACNFLLLSGHRLKYFYQHFFVGCLLEAFPEKCFSHQFIEGSPSKSFTRLFSTWVSDFTELKNKNNLT